MHCAGTAVKSWSVAGILSITSRDNSARAGEYETAHGVFKTPNFMPVGTRGSVKGVDVERLWEVGAQIVLVNTYHLWLRPGEALIKKQGGIHEFCGWPGPILSDSGGYQVFSLKSIRRISEGGVEFNSHIDGALCFLSPEKCVQIQEDLGVDIAMMLDECPAGSQDRQYIADSLEMTNRWAGRALAARRREEMSLFGITQGGGFRDLRTRAAETIGALPFDGYAIGGLSVGEPKEVMYEVLSYHRAQLPGEKICYLMGVGTPEDIVEAVKNGVDLFDCVMPTRAGRFGRAFVNGDDAPFLNIKNAGFKDDAEPLDPACGCVACRRYSRSYINHLFSVGEMLGPQLLSVHNLTHYLELLKRIRESIGKGAFLDLYRGVRARWSLVASDNAKTKQEG